MHDQGNVYIEPYHTPPINNPQPTKGRKLIYAILIFIILPITVLVTSHDAFAACGQLQTKVYAKTSDRYPVGGAPQGFAIILDKNGNPKYYAASNGSHSAVPIPVSIFTYSTKPKLIKNSSFRIKGMNQLAYYSPSNLLFIHGYGKPMFSLDSLSLKNKSYSFYTDKFAYMDGGYIILAGAGNFTIYKDFIKSGSTPAKSKVAGPYQTKNAGGYSYNNGAFYSNGVFYQIGSGHGTGRELGAFDVDTGKKIGCWTASYNLDDGDAVNNKGYLTVMPDPNGTSYLEVREITGPANLLKLLKRNYTGKYAATEKSNSGGSSNNNGGSSNSSSNGGPEVQIAPERKSQCATILSFWCNDAETDGEGTIIKIIEFVISTLSIGIAVLGTIGIIYSGYLIMTARDDTAQVAKGKKRILEIVIGIVAWALLASLITLLLPTDSSILDAAVGIIF